MNGTTIKFIRLFLGLTQSDLAKKLNVHQTLLGKVETAAIPISQALENKLTAFFADRGVSKYDVLLIQILLQQRYEQKGMNKDHA